MDDRKYLFPDAAMPSYSIQEVVNIHALK